MIEFRSGTGADMVRGASRRQYCCDNTDAAGDLCRSPAKHEAIEGVVAGTALSSQGGLAVALWSCGRAKASRIVSCRITHMKHALRSNPVH
jgi:hypothetical protein